MVGDALEMATYLSSEVRYALRGALAGRRLPTRPGMIPSWSNASVDVSISRASGSMRFMSMSCPPPPCDVAVVQGHHHRPRGRLGGDAVGQHERRQRRRTVRFARDLGEPAHGLGQRAVAGSVARSAHPARSR